MGKSSIKKVLITGGAGFIGSSLAIVLVEKGYEVTILDSMSPQIHGEDFEQSELYQKIKNITAFVKADIMDKDIMLQLLTATDNVIHLAAETGTGQSMYNISQYNEVNCSGTALIWEILANNPNQVKKVIVASSRAIYGEGKYECNEHGIVYPSSRKEDDMIKKDFGVKCPYCNSTVNLLATDETSKIKPGSVYGLSKYYQEELSLIMGKSLNIPVVALRYQNVYGPGQSLQNPYTGILSIFSTLIKNNKNINIFEDGTESRDFVYIDDVVAGTILAMEEDAANYESFNIGTGEAIDVQTVAKTLIKFYNTTINYTISGNFRLGDIRHNKADITKIKTMLGYAPSVYFNEGIEKFVNWVNKQEVQEDKYEISIKEMRDKGLYK
jgi:dTDP-L-rhamnose 4-epimerase